MKKLICAFLASALILGCCGCKGGDSSGTASGGASGAAPGGSQAASDTSGGDTSVPVLSNPVAMTEDGDVDMTVAMAYQTDFDALLKSLEEKHVNLDLPVSENAQKNEKTMEVWNYLKSIYGKQILSAQQQMDNANTFEDKVFYAACEDIPAMKGFDFIFCTGSYSNTSDIDAAIKWANESGGLVTFTWHWNVPRDVDKEGSGWAFYMKDITNFDAKKATTPGTKEYEVAVHDIDLIASYLQKMESAGVTVLFRPFHEGSGSWFWWGIQNSDYESIKAGTYDTYQRLYYMMFDRLENYHKLSNIIWVWNGQSKYLTVNPNTYDIAGVDYYAGDDSFDHSSQVSKYKGLAAYTYEGKMLALSECGFMPDPQQCVDDGAMWLYYMIWNGDFVYETTGGTALTSLDGTPRPNEKRLNNELIVEYYGNDALITWNKLPEFSFGKHDIPTIINTWNYFRTKD